MCSPTESFGGSSGFRRWARDTWGSSGHEDGFLNGETTGTPPVFWAWGILFRFLDGSTSTHFLSSLAKKRSQTFCLPLKWPLQPPAIGTQVRVSELPRNMSSSRSRAFLPSPPAPRTGPSKKNKSQKKRSAAAALRELLQAIAEVELVAQRLDAQGLR